MSIATKLAVVVAALGAATACVAQGQTAVSPLVKQINNSNWLDAKEAESLRMSFSTSTPFMLT